MRIWAFVSQKGGSGKTTLTTQLAVYGGSLGEKVVILDMDEQKSAFKWHVIRGEGTAPHTFTCPAEKLSKVIDAIRDGNLASLVLLDTAPHTNRGAAEAISASDLVICPTKPSMLDLSALEDTIRLIELSEARSKTIVVLNSVHAQGAAKAYDKAAGTIERFGVHLADTHIGDRVAFVRATDAGKGVTEMSAKSGDAAKEIISLWGELAKAWPTGSGAKKKEAQHDR